MGTLKEYYQEKYGKPSQAPSAISVFSDGQKLGAAFKDELGKLQAKFAEEVKKDTSTHPVRRFLTHPATTATWAGLSGASMGHDLAGLAGHGSKGKAVAALLAGGSLAGFGAMETMWHRQNAAERARKGEKAHWINRVFGPATMYDKALVGRRNAGTEADFEKETK